MKVEKIFRAFFSSYSPHVSKGTLQVGPQAACQSPVQVKIWMHSTAVLNLMSDLSHLLHATEKNQADTGAQPHYLQPSEIVCDTSPMLSLAGNKYQAQIFIV